VVFVIVGGTEAQVAHWKDRARQLQVAEAVTFVGSVTLAESLRHLQVAEILVSPRTEGLSVPLKLYSYLKSGKPIVATDVNAHAQILDGEISVLVEANPEAFSKGILLLVRNADLRTQIGNQAKAFAEREFSREVFLAKLERAYTAARLGKPVSEIPNSEVIQRIHSVVSILA
jgi:glycosyltransferase involved in cell wall biosynthesis